MSNAYETGARKAIPAVLVYVFRGDQVLMIHRGARGAAVDYHYGKWNGLGGKLEPDESYAEAARREVREESGLTLPSERFVPIGFLHFPNFKAHKSEDWLVQVFIAEVNEEEATAALSETDEGSLHWIPSNEVHRLNLWTGDRHFIPWVMQRQPFLGTFWYRGQELDRHELTAIQVSASRSANV